MAIDFAFTEEHEELRATVRAFLEEKSDEEAVRTQMATDQGYDTAVWQQLAEQLAVYTQPAVQQWCVSIRTTRRLSRPPSRPEHT